MTRGRGLRAETSAMLLIAAAPCGYGSSLLHWQAAKALLPPWNESGLGRAGLSARPATDNAPADRANRQVGADMQCGRSSFVGWSLRIGFSFKARACMARSPPRGPKGRERPGIAWGELSASGSRSGRGAGKGLIISKRWSPAHGQPALGAIQNNSDLPQGLKPTMGAQSRVRAAGIDVSV
jgi:hypothetical protein